MKDMKKTLMAVIAVIACTAVLCAAVWAYPLLQAARTLKSLAGAQGIDFEINIALNRDRLSEGQERFLETAALLLQTEESSCMSWEISGRLSGGHGYAEISCEGLKGAVTDVYFSKDYTVVNVKMLYEALRDNFMDVHPVMGNLMKDWEYSDYVSLEQLEEIFQVEIGNIYRLDLPEGISGQNTWLNLLALCRMDRKKSAGGRRQFGMQWDSYQVSLEIGESDREPEDSAGEEDGQERVPGAAVYGLDTTDGQIVKSYEAEFSAGAGREITFPDSVMGQKEIEQFQGLRDILRGIWESIGMGQ